MKNFKNKGFTLIELLAVITIMGVVGLIAVMSVTEYMNNSRKNTFINDARTYVQAARLKYNGNKIPQEPDSDEALIIPISTLDIDENKGYKTSYGVLDLEKSYIIVTRSNDQNTYYITMYDSTGVFLDAVREDDLNKSLIDKTGETFNVLTLTSLQMGNVIDINGSTYKYLIDETKNNPNWETFLLKIQ